MSEKSEQGILSPKDLFVAEFSPDQNCFHVQTLKEHLTANYLQIIYKKRMDRWQIIFVHSDIEECFKFIEVFKKDYERICESNIYIDYDFRAMLDGK
jgi:hypothetical protein